MYMGAEISSFLGAWSTPWALRSTVRRTSEPSGRRGRVPMVSLQVIGSVGRDEAAALLREDLATGPAGPVADWGARMAALLGRADLDARGQLP